MNLNDAINQIQAANAEQIRTGLAISPQRPSESQVALFRGYELHCQRRGTRPVPTPALVADWLNTLPDEALEPACAAIVAVTDHLGLPNSVATLPVRAVLSRRLKTEAPRSWSKQDRELYSSLPIEIRRVLTRREDERTIALRRKQNELSQGVGVRLELKKFLDRNRQIRKHRNEQ
jgi:hypothetical protein